jgi:D-alanyl-lipoteichoic acid acyltransferase DltB (MBOAT superfamily)
MLFSASVDFISALKIDSTSDTFKKKLWLAVSLIINLGMLCYFKYLFFFLDNAVVAFNLFGYHLEAPILNIILPLGISFYTFETISYVVDVYRGLFRAERSFIIYACFVTFFPKLIAGPILRAAELIPQLKSSTAFRLDEFSSGLTRIIYGLFLKVVVADNIAPLVDSGFQQPLASLSALDVWTLAFLFGFQIYFDFSAYSSIAIGSARLMGIHIPENFNFPYIANSPREFWRRWHISLSSWIRDYLYFPLQGIKVRDRSIGGIAVDVSNLKGGHNAPLFALFITWLVMGLWHGANWTFALWGLYHASLIAGYRLTENKFKYFPVWLKVYGGWAITLPLIMLGWIPFRSESVESTFGMFYKLISPSQYLWLGMRENTYLITVLLLMASISSYAVHKFNVHKHTVYALNFLFYLLKTIILAIVIGLVFIFLRPINQFIYFQF